MSGLLNNESSIEQSRRLAIGLIAAAALLVIWQTFLAPPPPAPSEPGAAAAEGSASPSPSVDATSATPPDAGEPVEGRVAAEVPLLPDVEIATEHTLLRFTNAGGRLTRAAIRAPERYIPHEGTGLVFPSGDEALLPLGLRIGGLPDLTLTSRYALDRDESAPEGDGWRRVTFRWTSPDGAIEVVRRYEPSVAPFATRVHVEVHNRGTSPRAFDGLSMDVAGGFDPDAGGMLFGAGADVLEALCVGSFGTERESAKGLDEAETFTGEISFVGLGERYFLTALVPGEDLATTGCDFRASESSTGSVVLRTAPFSVAPGAVFETELTLYTGPKDETFLRQVDPSLTRSIDLGWFSALALPIRWFLLLFQGWVGNWGLAIILLTVFIKTLLFPITNKSYVNMEKMREVQPRLKELQEKYKNDNMKLAEAQMKLFKESGTSPLGGCLPMILQMPIYIALYRTVWGSAELYNAPFMLWIQDLSSRDPWFILPVAMGVIMWVQQKMMPPPTAPQGEGAEIMMMMTRVMPVMFTVFMLFLPSGLVLYILANMVLSIGQQLMIRKRFERQRAANAAKS